MRDVIDEDTKFGVEIFRSEMHQDRTLIFKPGNSHLAEARESCPKIAGIRKIHFADVIGGAGLLFLADALERLAVVLHVHELPRRVVALHPVPVLGVEGLRPVADGANAVVVAGLSVFAMAEYHRLREAGARSARRGPA